VAGGEEIDEAGVAEDLQLLADFVADVVVPGVQREACCRVARLTPEGGRVMVLRKDRVEIGNSP